MHTTPRSSRAADRIATRHPKGARGPSLQGDKYREMRDAIFQVLAAHSDGIELSSLLEAVKPLLSETVYEPGSLTTWYCVNVELDLEARGQIERDQAELLFRVADA